MKRVLFILMIFIVFTTISFGEMLKIAVGYFPPYISEEEGENLAMVLVEEAFALEGIDVEFVFYPSWKRIYVTVENAKIFGSIPWFFNEERGKTMLRSQEELHEATVVFFHSKTTNFEWKTFDDLKKYRIGGVRGYTSVELLEKHGVELDITNNESQNLKKILLDRIDAYPMDILPAKYLLNKEFKNEERLKITYNPKLFINETTTVNYLWYHALA